MAGTASSLDTPKPTPPAKGDAKGNDKAKAGSENKQSIAVQLPPTINVNVGGKLEMKGVSEESKKHEQAFYESPEFWVAIFTGLLVFVTAYLVHYTKKLWRSTHDLVKDAKDTAKWDLRAYVSPADGTLRLIPGTTVLRAEVALRNSGRTPAHNVRYAITGDLRSPTDVGRFEDQDLSTRKQPIAPNAHWTVGHEFLHLTSEDIQDVVDSKKWVYVWGRAEYVDIFKRTQTLKFRYRNIVRQTAFDPETRQHVITGWAFYPEDDGNEAT